MWGLCGLVLACNRPTQIIQGINDTGTLSGDWHGLSTDAAWTYRDDAITDEAPEPAELVLARYNGDGQMELRRGERWADADPIGSLVFDLNNGLSLVSWNVDGASGEGNFPVYEGEPTNQSAVSNGSWTCQAAMNEDVETFYGIFPSSMRIGCTVGGGGFGRSESGHRRCSRSLWGHRLARWLLVFCARCGIGAGSSSRLRPEPGRTLVI